MGSVAEDDLNRALQRLGERSDGAVPPRATVVRVRHKVGSWRHVEALADDLLAEPNIRAIMRCIRDMTERTPVRVLVIDDVEDMRTLARLRLAEHVDFEVVGEAANAAEGERLAADLQPDAVIVDMTLPGTDGPETIMRLRAVAPSARILAVSATPSGPGAGLEEQARAAGANAFADKGLGFAAVIDQLAQLCSSGEQGM